MRVAIISDIHANIEAFQAVVNDLQNRADRVLNLGDLVGYNASPNECVDLAKKIGLLSVQGNHDKAVCNQRLAESFNIFAYRSILWTQKVLTPENTRYLCSLAERFMATYGLACHGSPEGMLSYVELHFQAKAILKKMKKGVWGQARICLFGHTHKRKVWHMDVRGKVAPVQIPPDGALRLNPDEFYLLNPGSVGQPRNGDPRSSYLIFDTKENSVCFRQVDYDRSETIRKIIDAELPEFFAKRLRDGT